VGRGRKIGVVLILVGICIPILAMLFASGYNSRQDLIWNVQHTEWVFWTERVPIPDSFDELRQLAEVKSKEEEAKAVEAKRKVMHLPPGVEYLGPLPIPDPEYQTLRSAIPCSIFFGLGIILTAIGIGLVVCSPKR